MKESVLTKLKASKGTQTALALLLFFAAFNLLSIGDIWKYTLEPIGLHTWIETLLPQRYQSYERLFLTYSAAGDKYMAFYCWNIFLGFITSLSFSTFFIFIPSLRNYLLSFLYLSPINATHIISSTLAGIILVYVILNLNAPSNQIGIALYYNGYLSLVIVGWAFATGCTLVLMALITSLTKNYIPLNSTEGKVNL